ncbi:hypothetical protein TNCV_4211451 [Trichonephila clavipes]|nr:hypothetical protein TNCV_4211451 [Trichonephila clavipes]
MWIKQLNDLPASSDQGLKIWAFRAISATPGRNIVKFIDSQIANKTTHTYLATIYSHQNLSSECKQLINSILCTRREVVLQSPSHCGIHGIEQADKLVRGFDAASTLPSDAASKRQATSQGQISTQENFHSYRPSCWQILISSA